MENKLKCRPVLLPAVDQNIITDICLTEGGRISIGYEKYISSPQHLYLVSDREIKEGDYYFNQDRITLNTIEAKDLPPYWKKVEASTDTSLGLPGIPKEWIEKDYVAKQGKIDKVYISIYDYENVAGIVEVDMENQVIILPTVEDEKDYPMPGDGFGNFLKGQLGLPGKVVINKPKEKKYTREEVIDMMVHCGKYPSAMLNEGYNHLSKDFPSTFEHHRQRVRDWMDLNYPEK